MQRFKLRKPSAYHWDFFVLGLCAVPSALLGLPLNNGLIPQVRTLAACGVRCAHADALA